jgi:hypothetical protein
MRFSIFVTSRRQDIILLFNSPYTRLGFPVEDLLTFTQSSTIEFTHPLSNVNGIFRRYIMGTADTRGNQKGQSTITHPPLVKILIALGISLHSMQF